MRVAVVGAGVAGLACARELQSRGCKVEVFEKSRGAGGRMPTRWVGRTPAEGGFDHGTQYFSADHPVFHKIVHAASAAGALMPWEGTVVDLAYTQVTPRPATSPRWVGTPGMSAFGSHLADGMKVHLQTRVQSITRKGGIWTIDTVSTSGAQSSLSGWDWVVAAIPAEQAVELLQASTSLSEAAASVTSVPNWTVMLEFDDSLVLPFDGAFVHDSPLGWVARDSSKPGRVDRERWVLQATGDWSLSHLELPAEEAGNRLADVFLGLIGSAAVPADCRAHRWRYSTPINPLDVECLIDRDLQLGACGDWLRGARVEAAWLSGWALGQALPVALELPA